MAGKSSSFVFPAISGTFYRFHWPTIVLCRRTTVIYKYCIHSLVNILDRSKLGLENNSVFESVLGQFIQNGIQTLFTVYWYQTWNFSSFKEVYNVNAGTGVLHTDGEPGVLCTAGSHDPGLHQGGQEALGGSDSRTGTDNTGSHVPMAYIRVGKRLWGAQTPGQVQIIQVAMSLAYST